MLLILKHCRTRNFPNAKSVIANQQKLVAVRHGRWTCMRTCATEPSSSAESKKPNLVPLKSIPNKDLGFSLLRPEANTAIRKAIVAAKV